jgi:secreted trypsin-like serine protease
VDERLVPDATVGPIVQRVQHARRAARLALPLLACAALLAPTLAHAQDAGTRIVGGTTAEANEYPWQIALFRRSGQNLTFRCGGTLIADTRVLTAAHCTDGVNQLAVRVGSHAWASGGTIINVTSAAEHPDYDPFTLQHDAALLELAASGIAAGGEPLQLIGQEGSGDDQFWSSGDMLAISGWGSTSQGGSISSQLREARVPRVADSTCSQDDWYGGEFDSTTMVCAGFEAGGVDTCQGDSGGPLAAPTVNPVPASETDPSEWRLVGITSWGDGCAQPKKPGVYTRVAAPTIRSWILGTPPPTTFTLNVSVTGNGDVTSSPTGINCGSDCSHSYLDGTDVTLTADPDAGESFVTWGGACSGSSLQCTVPMTQSRSVTAEFSATTPTPTHTLVVSTGGTGSGTVTSAPAGINCGSDCSENYDEGTEVALAASATSDSTFGGWSGACSGTGPCNVSMDGDRSVTATFIAQPPPDDTAPPEGEPPPPEGEPPPPEGEPPPPDDDPTAPFTPGLDDPLDELDETPPVAEIASKRLRMSGRGYVRVRIDCSDSPEDCLGLVKLRLRFPADATAAALRTIARKRFEITAGEDKRVRMRLRRRARRYVRREGRVRVRVVAVVEDAAGNARTLRARLPLLAPR